LQKFKKTYSFRLEPKEQVWIDNRVKTLKLSPSTVIRDLIRKEITIEGSFTPRFGGKTLADWEAEMKVKNQAEAAQA